MHPTKETRLNIFLDLIVPSVMTLYALYATNKGINIITLFVNIKLDKMKNESINVNIYNIQYIKSLLLFKNNSIIEYRKQNIMGNLSPYPIDSAINTPCVSIAP